MCELLISINNSTLPVTSNNVLFQSCLAYEVYLPRFCYHVALSIAGNCRMCLIEEKNSIKPLIACATSCEEGQNIFTNTEAVAYAREGVLEFLLINHPLDCPICDQGGECDLQDQVIVFGADFGRFYEDKKTVPNKNFGAVVKTFFNRCIYCTRCVRFFEEFGEDNELLMLGRSENSEIGLYLDYYLRSELAGNVTDLCPVGALLIKPTSFRGRFWEYQYVNTFDIMDSLGAEIRVDIRGLEIIRILPKTNDLLNDEWISDRSRFFVESLVLNRFLQPTLGANFIGWEGAFFLLRNTWYLWTNTMLDYKKTSSVFNMQPSEFSDLETLTTFKELSLKMGSVNSTFYPFLMSMNNEYNYLYLLKSVINIDHLRKFENVVIVSLNLRYRSPVLNMQLKQLVTELDLNVFVIGSLTNTNYAIKHLGNNEIMLSILGTNLDFIKNSCILSTETISDFFLKKYNVIGFNISDTGFRELNFSSNLNSYFHISRWAFCDNSAFINDLVAASGMTLELITHQPNNFGKSNTLSVPSSVFLERSSTYLNNYGDFLQDLNSQESERIFYDNKILNWKLLRAIANSLNDLRNFMSLKELRARFFFYSYNFESTHYIFKKRDISSFFKKNFEKFILFNTPLKLREISAFINTILGSFSPTLSLQARLSEVENDYTFCRVVN